MPRPPTRRLRIAALPTAPRRAREFLTSACTAWHAEQFIEPGSLVLSELVSNAVLHAGTDMDVELRYSGRQLRVSVHDSARGSPRIVPAQARAVGGHGLEIVSKVARSWGVAADPDGGKDVWCVLQVDD